MNEMNENKVLEHRFGRLIETIKDKYDENKYIKLFEKVVIAKGGDGTLLNAIRLFRKKNVPFFGVNAGTVGFLMNDDLPTQFETYKLKKFSLIKVKVSFKDYNSQCIVEKEFQAFNDIMLGGDMNSWIHFDIKEKDDFFGKFSGGGIIISTPQGSTGINKNNGGVILPLSSALWSITGDKTSRKIEYVIKPRKISIDCFSRTPITLWVDGQNYIIKDVTSIEITRGDSVEVLFSNYDDFKKRRRI